MWSYGPCRSAPVSSLAPFPVWIELSVPLLPDAQDARVRNA